MRSCPFCAEPIQDAATVCKHCGRDVPATAPPVSTSAPAPRGSRRLRPILYVVGALALLAAIGRLSTPTPPPAITAEEQAARSFAANQSTFQTDVASLRTYIAKRQWTEAARIDDSLNTSLQPLFLSRLANDPAVAQLRTELTTLEGPLRAHQEAERRQHAAVNAADAQKDITVIRHNWRRGGFGAIALWSVTLKNTSTVAAFSDLQYETTYEAPSGTRVARHTGRILDVVAPGQTRSFEVNDGPVDSQARRATFRIVGARPTVP